MPRKTKCWILNDSLNCSYLTESGSRRGTDKSGQYKTPTMPGSIWRVFINHTYWANWYHYVHTIQLVTRPAEACWNSTWAPGVVLAGSFGTFGFLVLPGFGPGFFLSLPSRLVFTGVAVAPPAPDWCWLLLLGSVDSFQVWSQTYFFLFVFSLNKTIMDVPGKQINDHSLGTSFKTPKWPETKWYTRRATIF